MKSNLYVITTFALLLVLFAANAHAFSLEPLVEAGTVFEGQRTPKFYWKVGAAAEVPLSEQFSLEASTAYSEYTMLYYTIPPGPSTRTVTSQSSLNETKLDYQADLKWQFLHQTAYECDLFAGYRGMSLDNAFTTFNLGAPVFGTHVATDTVLGRLSTLVSVAPVVYKSVSSQTTNALAIVGSETRSLYGDPYFITDYGASLAWHVSTSLWLKAAYNGEMVSFQRTERLYNGAALTLIF